MTPDNNECCPKCGKMDGELVDTKSSDDFDYDKVCSYCIVKHSKRYAREGERGQGQRPIGEQRAIDRAERCGSGWPR